MPKRPSTSSSPPADHLRCRKNDGKRWRCNSPALPDQILCQHHYSQQRRKLSSHSSNPNPNPNPLLILPPSPADATAAVDLLALSAPHNPIPIHPFKLRRKRAPVVEGEGVVLALEVPNESNMPRVRRRELANGVMIISPAPLSNGGEVVVDRKIGLGTEEGVVWARRVRSKNVEPVPIGPVKILPVGRKRKKRSCHRCGTKEVNKSDRCMKCKKVYLCFGCRSNWFQQLSELESWSACPVCRGLCNCETCLLIGLKDGANEDIRATTTHEDVNEINHLELPIPQQLSEQNHIIQYELNELEIEAIDQGRRFPCIQFPVAEPAIVNCKNCKTLLGGYHRSCTKCSYRLCLSCSGKFRYGALPDLVENGKSSKTKMAFTKPVEGLNGVQPIPSSRFQPEKSSLTSSESKDKRDQSSISCPSKVHGGCNDGILRLMFLMPFGRLNDVSRREEGFV